MDSVRKMTNLAPGRTVTRILVLGAQLVPDDIAEEGLLTPEDYRDLALDHIERTCAAVFRLQIVKRA
ncbi:MAG: hypothetical protein SGI92_06815 [Bryobacteraceae bacterium]|nr:hypothetical protein [Bryobacteraceae bacterium]